MKRTLILVFLSGSSIFLSGCSAVDAPENMEEMMVFGFAHFDDDAEFTIALGDEMLPWLNENEAELTDGYLVDSLGTEHLEAAGIVDASIDGVIGAATTARYEATPTALAVGLTWRNKSDIFEDTLGYEVTEETDLDCFLAQTCDEYEMVYEQHDDLGTMGEAWTTSAAKFRWMERGDGTYFLLIRTLTPDPVELSSDLFAVHQQYAYSFIYDEGTGSRRVEGFWVEPEIMGVSIPDGWAVTQAVNRMHRVAEQLDAFLATQ